MPITKIIVNNGDRFGRWTIIKEMPFRNLFRRFWAKCDCGTEREVTLSILRKGQSKSCGCLHREIIRSRKISTPERTKILTAYINMKGRCNRINHPNYYNYGGRGIQVCNEWLSNFDTFFLWSIENGFDFNLTIDRINNNGNYEPSNCRWVSRKVQSNNVRRNKMILYKGEELTMAEICDKYNIQYSLIESRLRRGWSISESIETPVTEKFSATFRSKPSPSKAERF